MPNTTPFKILAKRFAICAFIYAILLSSTLLLAGQAFEGTRLANFRGIKSSREWFLSFATKIDMPLSERLTLIKEENSWKNSLVMCFFPRAWQEVLPHMFQCWLRNWILCMAVYYGIGGLWSYYAYLCYGDKLFPPGEIPALADMLEQIKVSSLAMPLYSLLPTVTEYAAEKGWTVSYPRVENVGLPACVLYFFLYMTSVEFGVYWMHRWLHDVKPFYTYLHYDHHKYNKNHTLSPFAGLAFNPLDGIMQAVAYTWTMFYCPMHFLTHEILLFATGVWTINIHDCLHGNVWPIMGAGYHAVHHTAYRTNYGHYFVFFDHLFDSLETPEDNKYKLENSSKGSKVKKVEVKADSSALASASVAEAMKTK
uniref:Fatty acid hydroxylase domain-containing protein n=1 Tax=Polytomella parva TaxID=51329 RepID=A0A7S0YCH2_9CHLO|mmetsp:Transcript_17467/g.31916  ORF Transcript_17467/g.31916 Transcript_17467/m.31916 type:complete len:367 (+) Transcript_17467:229-1329(+)